MSMTEVALLASSTTLMYGEGGVLQHESLAHIHSIVPPAWSQFAVISPAAYVDGTFVLLRGWHPGAQIGLVRLLRRSRGIAVMISHCANPECRLPFHYLRGGRLYRFDVRQPVEPCKDVPNAICENSPSQASVYFWLCDDCSLKYTLQFSTRHGISVLPLQQPRRSAVVAHVAEAE